MNRPATKADVFLAQFCLMSMVATTWWISLASLIIAIIVFIIKEE